MHGTFVQGHYQTRHDAHFWRHVLSDCAVTLSLSRGLLAGAYSQWCGGPHAASCCWRILAPTADCNENSRQRCWHLVTELGKLFIKENQHERS
jgi:hypothetical protein